MAPRKGSIANRIRFGHGLGGGSRHAFIGSGFSFDGMCTLRLRGSKPALVRQALGLNVGRGAHLWGSSRALPTPSEARNGGMAGEKRLQCNHVNKQYVERMWCRLIFNGTRKVVVEKVFGHHTTVGASSCRYIPRSSDDANAPN